MSAPTDFIQNDDENLKKWIKEITEAKSLLRRMQNELEVEQAKGKLVVSKLEGDILKLEELINVSMSNENNRLKTLMVNQLIELNKEEVLANIYNELLKQREIFVKELPESLITPHEPTTDDGKIAEILLPDAEEETSTNCSSSTLNTKIFICPVVKTGVRQILLDANLDWPIHKGSRRVAATSIPVNHTEGKMRKGEDKTNIEEDILRIEGKIEEAEKEQINLKQCLVQHHEFLDELKIIEEFTNSNEPPLGEAPEMDTPISEVLVEKPGRHLWVDSENYEDPNSSNRNRNPISEAYTKSVIPSEHRATGNTSRNSEISKGTRYGPYDAIGKNSAFVLKTAKRMNRGGLSSDPNKRSKLDLYEVCEKTPTDPMDSKSGFITASVKKNTPAFKLKTPSSLRKTVIET